MDCFFTSCAPVLLLYSPDLLTHDAALALRPAARCRPGYLIANLGGPHKYWGTRRSHFDPWAALFEPREARGIIVT